LVRQITDDVKFVNGEDADDMTTAPHVAAGSTVTFTYVVTDTGNVPLANVVVIDNQLGIIAGPATGDINGNGLLDLTETWTYTITATAVAGQQTNLGTVTAVDANNPPGTPVTDDNPANYFGDAPVDLSVTKDDGVFSVVPGTSTTYLITVTNFGPTTVSSVTLTDATPFLLLNPAFGLPSEGSYDPVSGEWSGLSLASGGSVSITLTGTTDPNATGSLTNTAMVAAPAGTIDTDPANNSATDVDSLTPQGDLVITKTDGATSVVPGTSPTYTIVVSNTGPSAVTGASVSDPLPAGVTGATWTATGFTGGGSVSGGAPTSGTGALATTVDLPVGATVTFTFTPTIDPGVTGSLANTATVTPPAGVTDPFAANNSVTDTDTLTPEADLSITKTDGVPTVAPGGGTTYNIVVSNTGPSTAVDATVTDLFPGAITNVDWTAVASGGSSVAQATGTGNILTTVTLLPGGTATFTAVAQISPAAIGSLTNTASVSPPAGVTDPDLANNTATDTDTLPGSADLAITKTDGVTTVLPGAVDTYTITVSNNGPDTVSSVTLFDAIPAALLNPVFGPPLGG
jgi:uncharacterized repeat protein (TIGR01451 family)